MRFWNKKGATEEVVDQIPYIIMTVIVMAAIYLLLSIFTNAQVDPKPVQEKVFLYRMLYQPNALSYTDPDTGRVYPGIIDDAQISDEHLSAAFQYSYERQVTARFEITSIKSNVLNEEVDLKTVYYNKVLFERMEPLADLWRGGAGSATKYDEYIPVTYKKGTAYIPANMHVTVIIPGS